DFGRTEQLADIDNFQEFNGNHGWGTFATALRDAGYDVSQITETVEPDAPATGQTDGVHIDLETIDLLQYDVVVFGSNNATYDQAAVDAFEDYVRRGGATLFISDANFGSNWGDAPASDQPFLDVIGWKMNQDRGTYSLFRDQGDFVVPTHPIFTGIDRFDGEGVSPVNLADATTGQRLAVAKGNTSDNDRPGRAPARSVTSDDASLAIAELDGGRIAAHFDRNTFFNQNGAGTNINRFDNRDYAINLFDWLSGRIGDTRQPVGQGEVELDASQTIRLTFDEDVAESIDPAQISVLNTSNFTPIPTSQFNVAVTDFGRAIELEYDIGSFGPLPNGQYSVTLLAGNAEDRAGNTLVGDVLFNFDVLAGDANDDGVVDLADFGVLRANFGSPGLFSTGDFNYDGVIDLADFGILRANFGAALDELTS
ncbi:MAG: hypothetical protein AAF561_11700, partial [Planctomycetota bacterium]